MGVWEFAIVFWVWFWGEAVELKAIGPSASVQTCRFYLGLMKTRGPKMETLEALESRGYP